MLPVTNKEKELFHQLAKVKQNSKTQHGWLNVLDITTDKFAELLEKLKIGYEAVHYSNPFLPSSKRCVMHVYDYDYCAAGAAAASFIYDELISWPSNYNWTLFIRWEDHGEWTQQPKKKK